MDRKNTAIGALLFFAALVFAVADRASASGDKLILVSYGFIPVQENGDIKTVKEFRMSYGDTSRQEALSRSAARARMGPWGMNAANYYHNENGSWNLFNFRLPSESTTDPRALEERQSFRDYQSRPDVRKAVKNAGAKINFGEPGEFIFKRMGLSSGELPAPLNRLSVEALAPLDHIQQFNEDGTMKIYIKQPMDRDGSAQRVFQRIVEETSKADQ